MTKQFKIRVMSEKIVDTRKYRYVYAEGKIQRLKLEYLNTTAALTEWEVCE